MSEEQSSRRKFIKLFGLSAGATLTSVSGMAAFIDQTEIRKLNPEQREFMIRYGKWMDEFTELIKIQKTDPNGLEINKRIIALTEKVEKLRPQLEAYMTDKTFALIYKESIKRVTAEI